MSEAPPAATIFSIVEFAEIAMQGKPADEVARALTIAAGAALVRVHGPQQASDLLRFTAKQCQGPMFPLLARGLKLARAN